MKARNVFQLISTTFRDAQTPFILVGGYAMGYYRDSRFGPEIEILATQRGVEKALPLFKKTGCKVVFKNHPFVRLSNSINSFLVIDVGWMAEEILTEVIAEGKEIERAGEKFIIPTLKYLESFVMWKPPLLPQDLSMDNYVDWLEFNLRHNLISRPDEKDIPELTIRVPFKLK